MKIVSIEVIPVTLPYKTYASDAWGVYHSVNYAIAAITDEAGHTGYGEISLAWFGGVHNLCRDVRQYWLDQLIGMDTGELTRFNSILDYFCTFSKLNLLVKAGIEMALWDLLGKERQMPVHAMLGGKLRERIELTGGVALDTPEIMMEQAKTAVDAGFKELKVKVGLDDKKDLQIVSAIRSVIPDGIRLRVDANMAWKDRKQAKLLMDEMYEYGVNIVEQPLDMRDLHGLAWLRKNTKNKILIDEGVWDVDDARKHIEAEAADLLHVYISEAGGVLGSRKIFELAAAFGMDCTIGAMPEGIVGSCAAAHVAAAMPNLSVYPSDIRGFAAFREDVAVSDMRIQNGCLTLPCGYGLGFELDREKLESLRADR